MVKSGRYREKEKEWEKHRKEWCKLAVWCQGVDHLNKEKKGQKIKEKKGGEIEPLAYEDDLVVHGTVYHYIQRYV